MRRIAFLLVIATLLPGSARAQDLRDAALPLVETADAERVDPQTLTGPDYYDPERFPGADPDSVFHPDGDLHPAVRALLIVQAREPEIGNARWRVETRAETVEIEGRSHRIDRVEIARFNLEPAMAASIAQSGAPTGDREASDAPDVIWRFAMRPVQGMRADVLAASRDELDPDEVAGMDCLTVDCGGLDAEPGGEELEDFKPALDDPDPTYAAALEGGIASPALALEETLAAARPEPVDSGAPPLVVVISVNDGPQVASIKTAAYDAGVMDHAIAAIWTNRLQAEQFVQWSRAFVPRDGPG